MALLSTVRRLTKAKVAVDIDGLSALARLDFGLDCFIQWAVPPGFCDSMIAVNSAEFANFMISVDFCKIIEKSIFSTSFTFLKHQSISIIKRVKTI